MSFLFKGNLPLGQRLKTALHPTSLFSKPDLLIELEQIKIAINDIKADAMVEFPQAYRAQMHWSGIAFLEMI
jgi:hypothetical protein